MQPTNPITLSEELTVCNHIIGTPVVDVGIHGVVYVVRFWHADGPYHDVSTVVVFLLGPVAKTTPATVGVTAP